MENQNRSDGAEAAQRTPEQATGGATQNSSTSDGADSAAQQSAAQQSDSASTRVFGARWQTLAGIAAGVAGVALVVLSLRAAGSRRPFTH